MLRGNRCRFADTIGSHYRLRDVGGRVKCVNRTEDDRMFKSLAQRLSSVLHCSLIVNHFACKRLLSLRLCRTPSGQTLGQQVMPGWT